MVRHLPCLVEQLARNVPAMAARAQASLRLKTAGSGASLLLHTDDLAAAITCVVERADCCCHAAPALLLQLSGKNDHQYFGRPEHATNERPVYIADTTTGGADLVGEYAAAYAAAAVLFKGEGQAGYAATLFNHAKQAFAFAEAHPNT